MGGRGSSGGGGGSGGKQRTVNSLLKAGGKRWQKDGKDRIYLRNAISVSLTKEEADAAGLWSAQLSRSMRNILSNAIDSAYYDVSSNALVYNKTRYSWANSHIENAFRKLKK